MKKSHYLHSRLNKRVTFQQENPTPDDAGGYSHSWQDVATVWAEISPLQGNRGDEPVVSLQQEPRMYARVTIRYREGITPALRMVYDARAFNIISVINLRERNEQLELFVAEGVAL